MQLTCIDLDQPSLPGFRHFISAWLCRRGDVTLLVDPGPLSSVPHLVAELRRLGVAHLDVVLLTHIHIDHAGGTGALLDAYPGAQVVCHPEGVRHLVAPEKLWEGSRKVLGALAEAYGPIVPVPAARIGWREELPAAGVRAFLTPGHAQHHCCYQVDDLLFAGEVAGVRVPLEGGRFMRPATPPRFLLEVALDSVERMRALQPQRMVFAHYGLVEDAAEHLRIAAQQLPLWVRGVALCRESDPARREAAIAAWLREHDPVYRNVERLPDDIRQRERTFLGNTLRGMQEYVDGLTAEQRAALAAG